MGAAANIWKIKNLAFWLACNSRLVSLQYVICIITLNLSSYPVLSLFSDRTCTVLNVEGDAFGAGLLQHFVDKTSKHKGVEELTEVRMDRDASAAMPEHSPLIDKRGLEGTKGDLSSEKESSM